MSTTSELSMCRFMISTLSREKKVLTEFIDKHLPNTPLEVRYCIQYRLSEVEYQLKKWHMNEMQCQQTIKSEFLDGLPQ